MREKFKPIVKKIILNIPENKYPFFLELLNNMPFVEIDQEEIPESHKEIVRSRIKKSKNKDLTDWNKINFDFN